VADAPDAVADLAHGELEASIELLSRLVAEESVEGSPAIGRCLGLVADAVAPLGGSARWVRYDDLGNLLVSWGDPGSGERLLLCAHADVVRGGDGWSSPPFELTEHDGHLIGRGVCDMKGGLAAFVGALRVVSRLLDLREVPVTLVVTPDEEVGSQSGMVPLLRDGLTGSWAICGEPTGMRVFTGNRGLIWLEALVEGRGGHAGLAHALDNPIHVAAEIVSRWTADTLPARDERFDPPESSLSVTYFATDEPPVINIVPAHVRLGVDRRLLPGEDPEEVIGSLRREARACVQAPMRLDLEVRGVWPPFITADDAPLVRVAQDANRSTGHATELGTDSATNDSSWLAHAGISTILLGPGAPLEAHSVDEKLAVDELRVAIESYSRILLAFARRTKGAEADA
jgi:acetylornithine deacetylase/succinyl-diaminopimelate desuccinylase-like protein